MALEPSILIRGVAPLIRLSLSPNTKHLISSGEERRQSTCIDLGSNARTSVLVPFGHVYGYLYTHRSVKRRRRCQPTELCCRASDCLFAYENRCCSGSYGAAWSIVDRICDGERLVCLLRIGWYRSDPFRGRWEGPLRRFI